MLLYLGSDGSEAVAITDRPYGFPGEAGDAEAPPGVLDAGSRSAAVCAESFSEFLYRYWIENEILLAL